MTDIAPLRHFVSGVSELLMTVPNDDAEVSPLVLQAITLQLKRLIEHDDWLPEPFTRPHPQRYRQYLLYADALQRFSVVSFVWGPGQTTPVHDHGVWGLIGMLRGAETSQRWTQGDTFSPVGDATHLLPGDIEWLLPQEGDIHQVSNAFDDRVSISIHVYGANIGAVKRNVFDETGQRKAFISGYDNRFIPNLWDLSDNVVHAQEETAHA
ncbi:Predicted metal-dependent enzyme of the double-stranded beta helix superfamily [Kushneria avicenniae]|uniref:Predicted metal-dependent enzyme of the double-stranded beta helix superfamily n=1 Tax=Kushneria avicenniae TaxID=402385 RepID=A0A1I1LH74_9GAMM|nr:cysteine dioxygenase [Kushneria avicenniae]SFC72389.1 Predicted metal-dependent enzyme of the double-stranded beta helix superfamily [Kushneria avicenniae]